jgi:glycosyltransferase involved in cell wall biosynthesis
LPFHNRNDVLESSIRSVLSQEYEHLELILVDDGSTDGSSLLARAFADTRITHVSLSHRTGVCNARNVGIDLATGRFLAFQDSDDVWQPEKLTLQLKAFEEVGSRPIGAVGCGWFRKAHGRDLVTTPTYSRANFADILAHCVRGTGTPMLVLDRTIVDPTVRFDSSFPALECPEFTGC